MKIDEFLNWDLEPEVSITDSNFDITIKHGIVSIRCDIEGFGSRLSADCEIGLDALIESCQRLKAEVEARSNGVVNNNFDTDSQARGSN